jgi:glycosyltransferase involved in cell wall biosynthesis
MHKKKISVVTPCYNEEENVAPVYEAVGDVFDRLQDRYTYEHIFMDNCSRDGTVQKLRELAARDNRVKVIINARNFGPTRSAFNGLLAATGDAAIQLDADLQDPPEMIEQFIEKWEHGYKVVYGIRSTREESYLMQLARKLYYRLANFLSNDELPSDAGDFRLVDQHVIRELRKIEDWNPYIRGLIATTGFEQCGIPYHRKERKRGTSKASILSLVDYGLNGLISHSIAPLRVCMAVGVAISLLSVAGGIIYSIFRLFVWEHFEPGMTTIIVLQFFFNGILLFFLGVLGEYIGSIHSQVRWRPLVVEAERINFRESQGEPDDSKTPRVGE